MLFYYPFAHVGGIQIKVIESVNISGVELSFETSDAVFSPHGVDAGTLAMLSAVVFSPGDRLLDLGCGYGVVGIYAAKLIGGHNVVMSDIDGECVRLSGINAVKNGVDGMEIVLSDGFRDIRGNDFTLIISKPPYHADFSTAKHFIEKGFNRLRVGGKMLMVTKRRDWYRNKLVAIFGGVRVSEIDGYFVFCAEKRGLSYAKSKPPSKRRF